MGFLLRSLTGFVMVFALVACGGGGEDGAEPEPMDDAVEDAGETAAPADASADGEAVYAANCATCHGEGGVGGGPAAVGLEPPPADLTDAEWTTGDGTLSAIRNVVENGSPGTAMIAWKGTLTDAEIDAVSEYVHGLGGGQ